ncbi:MAG TPA: prolyl oligopeptidase family serine peptidase, partial [bacterium]|nr:prolyl oligopeptidase family serine peptidase [bacterium]
HAEGLRPLQPPLLRVTTDQAVSGASGGGRLQVEEHGVAATIPENPDALTEGPVSDPWPFLRKHDDPETLDWLNEERRASRAILDALPSRPWFQHAMEAIIAKPLDVPAAVAGDWLIAIRRERHEGQRRKSVVCFPAEGGEPRQLWPLEGESIEEVGSLLDVVTALDGSECAVVAQVKGAPPRILFLEVPSGQLRHKPMHINRYQALAWGANGTLLVIGSYKVEFQITWGGSELLWPELGVLPPGFSKGLTSDRRTLLQEFPLGPDWRIPLYLGPEDQRFRFTGGDAFSPSALKAVFDQGPTWGHLDAADGFLWHITDRAHPCRSVWRIPWDSPELAEEIIPGGSGVVVDLFPLGGHVVLYVQEGLQAAVRVHRTDGSLVREHRFPAPSMVMDFAADPGSGRLWFSETNAVDGRRIWRLDLPEGALTFLWQFPDPALNPDPMEVRLGTATAPDGTPIPYWVLGRTDVLGRPGPHAMLLSAYGAFNNVWPVSGIWREWPWVQAGGLYAWAATRGEGYFGKDWYRAGAGANKLTAVRDLVAVAESLVHTGLTAPGRIGLFGRSAGGWQVVRAALGHPDLFGAAVACAAVTDPGSLISHAPATYRREWSTDVLDRRRFSAMGAIRGDAHYPPMLLIGDRRDRRVPFADQSGRFARTLRDQCPGARVQLVPFEAGTHGYDTHSVEGMEETIDTLAFLAQELGLNPGA